MTWGFVAAGAATVVGGALSGKGQKDAADTQAQSADAQIQMQQGMFDQTNAYMDPFRQMGAGNIPMLQMLASQDFNREQMLGDYYSGGEYAMMNDAGMRNINAMNEAGGNVGTSAGGNALAAIAPQLGQQYLGSMYGQQMDKFNQLNSLVSMGQNAAAMQGNAAQNFGSQAAGIQQNLGNNLAASQMAQGNNMSNMVGNLGGLAFQYMNQPTMAGSINPNGGYWGKF